MQKCKFKTSTAWWFHLSPERREAPGVVSYVVSPQAEHGAKYYVGMDFIWGKLVEFKRTEAFKSHYFRAKIRPIIPVHPEARLPLLWLCRQKNLVAKMKAQSNPHIPCSQHKALHLVFFLTEFTQQLMNIISFMSNKLQHLTLAAVQSDAFPSGSGWFGFWRQFQVLKYASEHN